MRKIYWKQSWVLLKQNPLFSALYVLGTGLSIAMVVVIAVIYYVKLAPIYPETNRNREMTLAAVTLKKGEALLSSGLSYPLVNEWLYPLKHAEAVSASIRSFGEQHYVQPADGSAEVKAEVKYTDEHFFRVFPFRFVEGAAFTEADRTSGIRHAVLTESYARRLFGTTSGLVGKVFSLDYADVRVAGVVEGGSALTPASYGQIYLPYTCSSNFSKEGHPSNWGIGPLEAFILLKNRTDAPKVKAEVDDWVRKFNALAANLAEKCTIDLCGQPEMYAVSTFRLYFNQAVDWPFVLGTFALVFLVLLFVPALNLSGMISVRMERMLPELGIRKAFGATRKQLLGQVVWENLLLSGLGMLLGLVLSWWALITFGGDLFSLFVRFPVARSDMSDVWLGADALFAPAVFVVAAAFCLLINLLSALVPACHALRRPIVESLNEQN